jgi:hypothetical protein
MKMKNSLKYFERISIRYTLCLIIASSFFVSCDQLRDSNSISLFPVRTNNEYQYIDSDGKTIINPQFSIATLFREGLALVRNSGTTSKWGYISEDGKYVVMPTYIDASIFNEEIAWVVAENAAPKAINKKGDELFSLPNAVSVRIFHEGMAAYSIRTEEGIRWGFIDKKGNVIINPQFSEVGFFSDGKCPVRDDNRMWGFIGKEGKLEINYQFDEAEDFKNNVAVVLTDSKYGVINDAGKFIVNPQFARVIPDGKLYLIKSDNKWGWCDSEGKIVVNPQFDNAGRFNDHDFAPVLVDGKWGFINRDGKYEVNAQFDFALPFLGKLAIVETNGKFGFIGKDGKFLVNPQFIGISDDLKKNLHDDFSKYIEVKSDFFDLSGILNRISFDNPEGLSKTSTLKDVVDLMNSRSLDHDDSEGFLHSNDYDNSSNRFSRYQEIHLIFSEKILDDVEIDFSVIANAFTRSSYSYYDYSYQFNPDAPVKSVAYTIRPSGKALSKIDEIYNGLLKRVEEDQYIENNKSYGSTKVFSNNGKLITIGRSGNAIVCAIGGDDYKTESY